MLSGGSFRCIFGFCKSRLLTGCKANRPLRGRTKLRMRMMRRQVSAAGLLLVGCMAFFAVLRLSHAVRADEAKPAAGKELWKPEDFIFSESVGQYRISPDAKWLVWVKSAGDKDKDKDARFSNLYLSSLTESREIALTRGTDQTNQPRWSPDGEKIAFLSTRGRPK